MKLIKALVLAAGIATSVNAYAWFFFFIPGSVTRAVGDAITGAKGNICVDTNKKVGDVITSVNGDTAKVISLSGTSSICPNPVQPIRAEIEFTFNHTSKAGIELPDDYEIKPLTDLDRFRGLVLKAESKSTSNQGIQISTLVKKPNLDLQTLANNFEATALKNASFKEAHSQNPEQVVINGVKAVRFEVVGTLKGLFGKQVTYFYTYLEADNEFVLVDVYSPTEHFAEHKAEFAKIAEAVGGLHEASPEKIETSEPSKTASTITATANNISSPTQVKPVGPQPVGVSIESKLEELNKLFKDGLITNDEYAAKKKELLKGL